MITLKRILLENEEPTKTLDDVRPLVPQLIAAAQQEYDVWDQSGEDGDPELGFGGICQNIAEAMSGILSEHGIDPYSPCFSGEAFMYMGPIPAKNITDWGD